MLRNIPDGARVGGHVLANRAVAARRRQHELPALVAQRAGQAVDLGLRGHRDKGVRRQAEESLHPGDELRHIPFREGILEAEHGPGMRDLGEAGGRRRAEPLRRRIRPHQLREARLELAVLAHERVIFGVGNFRRVLVVIQLVVPRDLPREPCHPLARVAFAQSVRQRVPRGG